MDAQVNDCESSMVHKDLILRSHFRRSYRSLRLLPFPLYHVEGFLWESKVHGAGTKTHFWSHTVHVYVHTDHF